MYKELEYLKDKLESLQDNIDYNNKELSVSESVEEVQWYSSQQEEYEQEKEYLINIIKLVENECWI